MSESGSFVRAKMLSIVSEWSAFGPFALDELAAKQGVSPRSDETRGPRLTQKLRPVPTRTRCYRPD